ncbi:hypothetical protein ABPG72_017397 [Tetrahymena utriculariae]
MPIYFNVVQLSTPQQNQQLYDKVKLTLQRGLYYNPILFYTAQSLKFDFKNYQQMIQTYSSTAQISITSTNPIMGVFVSMPYLGVIISISSQLNQIVLQGPLSNLNKILQNKIFFSQHSSLIDQQTDNGQPLGFTVQIDDGINYSQRFTITLQDSISSFIHIKSQVKLQPRYYLQQQVSQKYSSANVPVIDEVSLECQPQTFLDQDGFQLSYKAYQLQSDGTFTELKSDYWFKFSNYQLRFYGNVPKYLLNVSITIKVVAIDGYTNASDIFTINLHYLPQQYVLNFLISILTPLLNILGIYKYRYVIVNYLNYNNIIDSKETIKTQLINQQNEFFQQIIFFNKVIRFIIKQFHCSEQTFQNLKQWFSSLQIIFNNKSLSRNIIAKNNCPQFIKRKQNCRITDQRKPSKSRKIQKRDGSLHKQLKQCING